MTSSPVLHSTRIGRSRRSRPALRLALALVVGAATVAAVLVALLRTTGDQAAGAGAVPADARAFLRGYVAPSGRVIRHDQGGDTVSEGQAYALLLADATGQSAIFDRVWNWTRTHLQRPDGLLAYHAGADGAVADPMPASDADLLTAWALSRAPGPQAASDHAQARRIAAAVLAHETISRHGRLLLAAGPWATGTPGSLDPSYWAPEAFAALARATGDGRWERLSRSTFSVLMSLTRDGATLPPDWARLDGGAVSATPAPNGQAPQVQYWLEAQRLVVWLASSCDMGYRWLAARWWSILSRPGRGGALALTPAGAVLNGQTNALPLIASAAAASAAGNLAARARLIAAARRVQAAYPTYYGGAWLALGESLLDGQLAACESGGGASS